MSHEPKFYEKTKMTCPICGANHWENVDEYRFKPSGMAICTTCGFVSYPSLWKSEEEIKEYYREEYRACPNVGNVYSGQRKLHFHEVFLNDLFTKWKHEDREIEVGEIGSAFGMVLNWIKTRIPKAKVSGTELTLSYRRNAYHEFGIDLTEDFDLNKKYDIIISYKVAEHQIDIDQKLIEYRNALKNDGYFYISVPCWFHQMYNFGMGGFDLEYYYSTNHINVWTRKLFESLLKKIGLKIVKQDHKIYDSTYLCQKCEPEDLTSADFENPNDIKNRMDHIKLATLAMMEGKFNEALNLWPNYPVAHITRLEYNRKDILTKPWDEIEKHWIEPMLSQTDRCCETLTMACDFAMRAKKFDQAIEYCHECLSIKPQNPVALGQMINILREKAIGAKTTKEKLHYFSEARKAAKHLGSVSLQHAADSINNVFLYNSKLPIPSELSKN